MFVRFVVHQRSCSSGVRSGAFQAAYGLRRSELLDAHDADRLAAALAWFGTHLARPSRFARSRKPHPEAKAICWFKRDANEHLARMREIRLILERYGILVEMVTSRRPGYIVYEDAAQVAALPFRDTTV